MPKPEVPSEATRRDLAALWREVDAVLAPAQASCGACGACCDFRVAEHRLFATKTELDVLLVWAAEQGMAPGDAGAPADERLCPAWRDGRCAVHPVRPLGCRLYVCDEQFAEAVARADRLGHERLRAITRRSGTAWWYGPAVAYLRRAM